MMLSRRSLVVGLSAVLAHPARADGALRLEAGPGEMVALTGPGVRRALLLPGGGARLLAPLACGGEMVTVAGVVLGRVEWAALAVALEDGVALLALEPLAWRGSGGARMETRLAGTGDRRHVLCRRDTAVPAGPTLWRREAWTDTLAWRAPVGLVDAPVRAPLAGTRQHVVAGWRRAAAAVVAGGPSVVAPALLAEIGQSGFEAAATLVRDSSR